MLHGLETYIPTVMAIMALVLFTRSTRWLCYATVILAGISEFMLKPLNETAIVVCAACLGALLLAEWLRARQLVSPFIGDR